MFLVTCPYGVLGQVWYLVVLIPDLPNFDQGLHCLQFHHYINVTQEVCKIDLLKFYEMYAGIFCVLRGRNSAPFPMEFRCLFPNFEEKIPIFKKKNIYIYIYFFGRLGFPFSHHTHTSYMVTFSFNLMAIACVIANLSFIDQK